MTTNIKLPIMSGSKQGTPYPKYAAHAGMVLLMAVSNILALLLISPMKNAGLFAFENPDSLGNIIYFLTVMVVVTIILLLLIKKNAHKIISAILALSLGAVIYYVVFALIFPFIPTLAAHALGIAVGIAGILLLIFYQEWYVIDIVGLVTSAGCTAIFGISLSPLPVIILLVLLLIYDYVSVHKTKHMLTLADGVSKQKMPLMFLVPKTRGYSYRKRQDSAATADGGEGRAHLLGLGDVILPGILIVSAQVTISGMTIFGIVLPALGAFIGSLVGLALLAIPLRSGKPQPGLPFINTGAILGFLLFCAITGSWDWLFIGLW